MLSAASAAFFCYCREDSDFALRLAEDLKAAGANVWLDQIDITPGQRWDRSVEEALKSCPRLVVILSPASVNSTNVQDEVSFALETQKIVVPVLYRDCAIPFRLRRVQYVDFRSDYARGLKLLLMTLGVDQTPERTTPARLRPPEESQPVVPTHAGSPEGIVIPPAVPRPYNLSFDVPTVGGLPPGWFNSCGFVGGVSTAYEIRVVPRPDGGNGKCVLVQNPRATNDEFGSLMQRFPASYLAGRTIRFEGEVKTNDVGQWAGLWLRADNDHEMVFFDNMSNRPIRGTTSWTRYTVDAPLPSDTVWLNYGIVLVGRGMIWADDFRFTVWNIITGQWTDF